MRDDVGAGGAWGKHILSLFPTLGKGMKTRISKGLYEKQRVPESLYYFRKIQWNSSTKKVR